MRILQQIDQILEMTMNILDNSMPTQNNKTRHGQVAGQFDKNISEGVYHD